MGRLGVEASTAREEGVFGRAVDGLGCDAKEGVFEREGVLGVDAVGVGRTDALEAGRGRICW